MIPRDPGEFGGTLLAPDARGHAQQLRRPAGQRQPRPRRARPEPQLPVVLAAGVRAGGRGPLLRPASPRCVRWSTSSSSTPTSAPASASTPTRGVILRPMGTQSDDDMTPEDLWIYKRLSALGEKLTGYPGDQHLRGVPLPPEGGDQRHAGLAVRAHRLAVLDGGDLGAQQGSRHHRLRLDPLVSRASTGRRPEAAALERRRIATARRTSTGIRFSIRSSAPWSSAAGTG